MISLFPQFHDRLTAQFLCKEDDQVVEPPFASLWQVHGSKTVLVREETQGKIQADGMITDQVDLSLIIRVADCQSFAFYSPHFHLCGLLHVGWKGILAGAIQEFLRTWEEELKASLDDTFVEAGPSLCQPCADFTDPMVELPGIDSQYIDGRTVALQRIADDTLRTLGIQAHHINRSQECTRCNPEKFWTYRGGDRERVKSGMGNKLVLKLHRI